MQKPVVGLSIGMCMFPPAQKTQNDRSVYRLYAWATFLSSYSFSYAQWKEMPCLASMCTNAKRDLLFQVPICNAWAYVFLIMAQRSRILSCNTTFFLLFWSTLSTVKQKSICSKRVTIYDSDPIVLRLPEYASHMWPHFFQTVVL